ncbi:MAG: Intracellular exo-alpha-L-arabinofuranosidase 2 [bacterium ADurb.Bin478]|nr:MAG: Intracellular exo-alpha-L-arabinofuranosidase 2 [bacterium ADurb.Bin478]
MSGEVLTASAMNAYNDFNKAETVRPSGFDRFTVKGNRLRVTVPAKSVVVLEIYP